MRVHVLQHAPFEGLGSIERWLAERAAVVTTTRLFDAPRFPDPGSFDLLIALGGPMSVNDERSLPWLAPEKRFVAAAVHAGRRVLGICLGAQLLASALGAEVRPGPHREIGWFEVRAAPPRPGGLRLPEVARVFHWHGQTFDLPAGALWLAESDGCKNQAFQLGTGVVGLQFHLEMTPASVDAMLAHCSGELAQPGVFIQSEAELRGTPPERYAAAQRVMDDVLAQLTHGIPR
jgi:GMP synthase-like glutamine amidotransferase